MTTPQESPLTRDTPYRHPQNIRDFNKILEEGPSPNVTLGRFHKLPARPPHLVATPKLIRIGGHLWRFHTTDKPDSRDRFDELVDGLHGGLTNQGFQKRMQEAVTFGNAGGGFAFYGTKTNEGVPKACLEYVGDVQGQEGLVEVDFDFEQATERTERM
jgi:hypothetical protein